MNAEALRRIYEHLARISNDLLVMRQEWRDAMQKRKWL